MEYSNFIRLEQTKTKLAGDSFSVTAVDSSPFSNPATGAVNSNYGKITITGVGTAFNSALSVGDVIQLCTDVNSYEKYITNASSANYKKKYSVNYEVILDEYIVTAKSGTSDVEVFVKPYTDYREEFVNLVDRAKKYLCVSYTKSAYDKATGTGNVKICAPILFYVAYKKSLTNSKTNDYVVNINQISSFHINASSAQNMDVHFADTGAGTRTVTVHNCFDYLNHVLTPYTQIENQRIFYRYKDLDLTENSPKLYSNYSTISNVSY